MPFVYPYKHPFRDGSTHVVREPLDFIARVVALVPRPRLNLTRFHGVIEDPPLIRKILGHLQRREALTSSQARAKRQSRSTLAVASPVTSAVSSMVRPAK